LKSPAATSLRTIAGACAFIIRISHSFTRPKRRFGSSSFSSRGRRPRAEHGWIRCFGFFKEAMMRFQGKTAGRMAFLLVLPMFNSCANRKNELYTFDLKSISGKSGPSIMQEPDASRGKTAALHLKASPGSAPLVLCAEGDSLPWKEAKYLTADIVHEMPFGVAVWIHFFERGVSSTPKISAKMGILPGLPTRFVLPLEYLDGQTFFMARQERR
jgi:hypothetical protein